MSSMQAEAQEVVDSNTPDEAFEKAWSLYKGMVKQLWTKDNMRWLQRSYPKPDAMADLEMFKGIQVYQLVQKNINDYNLMVGILNILYKKGYKPKNDPSQPSYNQKAFKMSHMQTVMCQE